MKKAIRIQLNSMKRAKQHVLDHPITPANALVTATTTALTASIATLESLDGTRTTGTGTYLGAAQERQFAKTQLQDALGALSAVSKTLDKSTHPDVAEHLKMRDHRRSYQALLAFGRSVIEVIEPIKQVFTDHGASATVVEDLEALIANLDAATGRKSTGINSQIGKTAALAEAARIGMSHLRKLDSILSQLYKNNPELYAAWKAAKRQQRRNATEEEVTTDGGSGSSGSGTTTPPSGS